MYEIIEELTKQMDEAGFSRLKDKFTWDKAAQKVDYYLNTLVSKL